MEAIVTPLMNNWKTLQKRWFETVLFWLPLVTLLTVSWQVFVLP